MCVCINFSVYSLCWSVCLHTLSTFYQPSAGTLGFLCLTNTQIVCIFSSLGDWPILSLFLDNDCIYVLILDYLATPTRGFLSAWCKQTIITMSWSCVRKSLLNAFFHFRIVDIMHQAQRHQDRTETSWGGEKGILTCLCTKQ